MKILRSQILPVLAAAIVLVICPRTTRANPHDRPPGARLGTVEVIRIARQAARRAGHRLSEYKRPEARYEYTRKDRSWFVFFDGRVPMPGNHFSVSIDDRTGETRVTGGK